ncbi:N-acetylmuramoyl-L-alanine amidase-like domain-containing protein [Larkinella sp. VNQ87]|uniref:N-acetylmuramoyl-L-alanine amidase-like domain-containing protein n=1 Tax=Larkinella sp. VNQ87 TaxID=3400921 RepID=UPI003C02904B
MMRLFTSLVAFLTVFTSFAQEPQREPAFRFVKKVPAASPAETAVSIGKSFLGRPYVAHTLEGNETEQLVVNFRVFDCTTFLETALALALTRHQLTNERDSLQFEPLFRKNLTRIRYRNGRIDGFASRLHYFSEWLVDNEQKGVLQDVTRKIGGMQVSKPVSYMTKSTWKYPQLADPPTRQQIALVESAISQQSFWLIPKKQIKEIECSLKEGDIIMLTASRPGLDMKHVGFVVWQTDANGVPRAHLLHASSQYGQVVISDEPLAEYVQWNRQFSGIRVARLKEGALQNLAYRDARRIN